MSHCIMYSSMKRGQKEKVLQPIAKLYEPKREGIVYTTSSHICACYNIDRSVGNHHNGKAGEVTLVYAGATIDKQAILLPLFSEKHQQSACVHNFHTFTYYFFSYLHQFIIIIVAIYEEKRNGSHSIISPYFQVYKYKGTQ